MSLLLFLHKCHSVCIGYIGYCTTLWSAELLQQKICSLRERSNPEIVRDLIQRSCRPLPSYFHQKLKVVAHLFQSKHGA
jgi:hypothetical protein